MASPMSVLSKTLQNISLSKIRELDSRRNSYEGRKRDFLDKARVASDPRDRLAYLLDGYKELNPDASKDKSLGNVERWLDQSRYDASIPESKLADFDRQLRAKLDVQSRKLDMAHLYSRLLTEWMEQSSLEQPSAGLPTDSDTDSFEVVERECRRQRLSDLVEKFESVVFKPLETSEGEIENFLDSLFPNEESREALRLLRAEVALSSHSLMTETAPFNEASLTSCIQGLLTEDILSDEKRAILKDFLESDVAKDEIADVLNMRFSDLKRWHWDAGEHGIPIMPRVGLNGKYRIWADDDILQMIFVQFIGVKLCNIMKSALKDFMTSVISRHLDGHAQPSQRDKDRQKYYTDGTMRADETVEQERVSTYLETFFLSQLPSSETSLFDGAQQYDNDADDNSEDESDDGWYSKTPKKPDAKQGNIKQMLLRQITTEMLIHRLRGVTYESPSDASGPVALVQTDMQWYGTSIPHSTIYAVMRYVGFEDDWIDFFRKYLEAPLNLDAASDYRPQLGPRTRMRGVPMAHASEKLIGELVLSFMDIAVNRKTGILLYRLHDDIWFCGEPEVSAQAWTCMESYAKVFGLEFNRKKTGSVYLHGSSAARDPRIVQTLPQGPVTVGFLSLDPESGKWAIDQARMGAHLDQLEKQLKGCSSVLAWVLTWNSCIGRFFSHTFGEPAFCLGSEHVDAVLDTYSRMLKKLFPTGSVVEHLKSMIQSRFNLPSSANLPDAFIYLPEQLGGLGLRNPFVPLFLVRKNITTSAESEIRSFLLREFNQYRAHKTTFDELPKWRRQSRLRSICLDEDESDDSDDDEEGNKPEDNDDDDDDTSVDDSDSASNTNTRTPAIVPSEAKTFMSLTEFGRFRERNSMNLHKMYSNMLSVPGKEPIKLSKEILDALSDAQNDDDSNTQGSSSAIRRGGFRGGRARGRGGFSSGGRQMTQEANPSRRLSLTPENKWFLALYVDELMETYGGLSLVDKQFLPGGTLSMMRDKKVTWQMVL